MAIYLDSASPDHARQVQELGFVVGITTNPALMAQQARPPLEVLAQLVDIIDGHVFYQVSAPTLEARTDEAWQAYQIRPDKVIIKVPATTENLAMVARLVPAGIECALTAVYSTIQVFLGTQVKASFVIPYYSRIQHQLSSAETIIPEMLSVVQGTETKMLAASFKSMDDVNTALQLGIRNMTLPLQLIERIGDHELTQQAIQQFADGS